ncbi:hypothetical protein Mbo2_068 [Rhodococcus phage Mbo2]|uniref:Uncharacterized protein n=1 Tax=Rhodococcus phage Mbo2 TaxID=2936911 RepID=A0A9E7LH81_9CAUD|nr:hypothetical protein Mbo2_068 [Rhodococcus phage Mbo2]
MSDNTTEDLVNHPRHYNSHPSGVEVIEVIREMHNPNLSSAWKYLSRHELKGNPIQDLDKARWHIEDEEKRRAEWESGGLRGVEVVVITDLGYVEAYAPFYRYIAKESDLELRDALVDIWNADKIDMQDEMSRRSEAELSRAKQFCLSRIRHYKAQETGGTKVVMGAAERAADEEANRRSADEFYRAAPEPVKRVIDVEAARKLMPDDDAPLPVKKIKVKKAVEPTDTIARSVGHNRNDFVGKQLLTEDGWIQISAIKVTRGGIVWITTADDGEYRFKPRDMITTKED